MDSIPIFLRLQILYIQLLFNFKPICSSLMSISFLITQRCLKFNKFKTWFIVPPKTVLAAIAYVHYYKIIDSISAARKDGIFLNSFLNLTPHSHQLFSIPVAYPSLVQALIIAWVDYFKHYLIILPIFSLCPLYSIIFITISYILNTIIWLFLHGSPMRTLTSTNLLPWCYGLLSGPIFSPLT